MRRLILSDALMREAAALALVLTLAAAAAGQAGRGSKRAAGTVIDENGAPVAGAKLVMTLVESESVQSRVPLVPKAKDLETAVFETRTDKKGRWAFNGLASAMWEVRVSAPGCVDTVMSCDLIRFSRFQVEIRLEKIKEGSYAADPALLEQANDLFRRKEYGDARVLYELYLAKDPGATAVRLIIGDCWRKGGDLARAGEAYRRAVSWIEAGHGRAEDLGTALGKAGECYREEGRLELAVDFLRRAAVAIPGNMTIHAELGELLFSMSRAAEAVPHFLAAIEIEPGNALLQFKLGLAYLNLDDWARARACLSRVIEIEPGSDLAGRARDLLAAIKDKKDSAS
jgi:tetratricopeptide (TPR) repeat protein